MGSKESVSTSYSQKPMQKEFNSDTAVGGSVALNIMFTSNLIGPM